MRCLHRMEKLFNLPLRMTDIINSSIRCITMLLLASNFKTALLTNLCWTYAVVEGVEVRIYNLVSSNSRISVEELLSRKILSREQIKSWKFIYPSRSLHWQAEGITFGNFSEIIWELLSDSFTWDHIFRYQNNDSGG